MKSKVIEVLKQVYDPEFPVVDIYTLGMIYDIDVDENNRKIYILMTLTSPMCPMKDVIVDMVKTAVLENFSNWQVDVELTFDHIWNPSMIKDEEVKKIFS